MALWLPVRNDFASVLILTGFNGSKLRAGLDDARCYQDLVDARLASTTTWATRAKIVEWSQIQWEAPVVLSFYDKSSRQIACCNIPFGRMQSEKILFFDFRQNSQFAKFRNVHKIVDSTPFVNMQDLLLLSLRGYTLITKITSEVQWSFPKPCTWSRLIQHLAHVSPLDVHADP